MEIGGDRWRSVERIGDLTNQNGDITESTNRKWWCNGDIYSEYSEYSEYSGILQFIQMVSCHGVLQDSPGTIACTDSLNLRWELPSTLHESCWNWVWDHCGHPSNQHGNAK